MAEENKDNDTQQQEGGEQSQDGVEGEVVKKGSKKFKLIILLFVVILIAGGIGGYFYYQKKKAHEEMEEANKKQSEQNETIYHDLDEIIVNLNTEGKGVSFMKMKITIELEKKSDFEILIKMLPRVMDVFQIYLRELRPTDMNGSIGLYRLREELLLRINKIMYPAKVKDLLFKEVLVQ